MARPTRGTVGTTTGYGTVATAALTVASGSNPGYVVYVQWRSNSTTVSSIVRTGDTIGAAGMTYSGDGWEVRGYTVTSATTGTVNLVVTFSQDTSYRVIAVPYTGLAASSPFQAWTRENDLSTVYGATVTADDELLSFAGVEYFDFAPATFTPTGTGQTELDDNYDAEMAAAAAYQQQTGTVTASWTFSGTSYEESNALIAVRGAVAAGPTINTQPTAQTVVRTNDSRTSATFTVAATGTGTLTYAWSVDDGGGYDPISNGGIYAGATSASLVVTPTSNAQTGYSYRCTVTDDNGSTDSSGAVLTVLTGPVLSAYAGTTDGSGQVVVNLTSDDPLTANGEVLLITATVDGVAVRTTVRPATP